MSLPINWIMDGCDKVPCCAKDDPCPKHGGDTRSCNNCSGIYKPAIEDGGICEVCIIKSQFKCHECFSRTAAHKVYCSSAPLCMKHDGLLEFVCPLDPQELEFVMNYIKENDNRPNIELHQHFANQIEGWEIMKQLYNGFWDFNENSECISFDLTYLDANEHDAFIQLTLKALVAYRDL